VGQLKGSKTGSGGGDIGILDIENVGGGGNIKGTAGRNLKIAATLLCILRSMRKHHREGGRWQGKNIITDAERGYCHKQDCTGTSDQRKKG